MVKGNLENKGEGRAPINALGKTSTSEKISREQNEIQGENVSIPGPARDIKEKYPTKKEWG